MRGLGLLSNVYNHPYFLRAAYHRHQHLPPLGIPAFRHLALHRGCERLREPESKMAHASLVDCLRKIRQIGSMACVPDRRQLAESFYHNTFGGLQSFLDILYCGKSTLHEPMFSQANQHAVETLSTPSVVAKTLGSDRVKHAPVRVVS